MGVAERRRAVGYVVAVVEGPVQLPRRAVGRDGGRRPAEPLAGVSQAVPRLGLAEPVAQLVLQVQRLLTERDGLLVVAEHGLEPADRVDGPGLPWLVSGSPVQVEGLLRVPHRLPVAALPLQQPGLVTGGMP